MNSILNMQKFWSSKIMGKKNRKERRANRVAQAILDIEIERKSEIIPEIVKDEALFTLDGEQKKEKKPKIILHPRLPPNETTKPEIRPFYDLWGDQPASKPKSKRKNNKKPLFAPTSAEAYNSSVLIKPKTEEENIIPPPPQDPSISSFQIDDGVIDTLVDNDVELRSADTSIAIPAAPAKPPKPVQFPKPIKKYYDQDTKKRLREEQKEAYAKLREIQERPYKEENERFGPEVIEEIQSEIEKQKNREPKPKIDKKAELYIIDEPALEVDEQASKLSELEPDAKGFTRLQRSFEIRRKVGLHE